MSEAQAKMAETRAEGSKSLGGLSGFATKSFLAIAAVAIAAGAAGVDLAVKYQASTASIAASAGISVKAATSITDAFLNQAFQTTFSAQQTASAYAQVAGQLGAMNGKALTDVQALSFMTQAQDLAEASGTNLASATSDLAKIMQAYQVPVGQAGTATNVLFNVAKDTGQSVDTLAQSLARARGSMGAAAPPLSVMTGLLVDLTAHGETGRQAMSTLNSAFTGIISPTAAVTKAQKDMGVSFINAKTGGLDPMSQILTELAPKLDKMSAAQAAATLKTLGFGSASIKLATTIQAGPGVLAGYIDSVNKAGSAQSAAEKNSGTLEGSIKKLGSGFQDLLTQLGQFLIPILTKVVSVVASVVTYFDKNRGAAVALGIGIGAVASVLGVFAVATGIAKLATIAQAVAMGAWTVATTVWSVATGAASIAMGVFNAIMDANPIALIVLAIAGLVAAFVLLVTHLKQVGQILGVVFGWFKAIPKEILGVFVGAVTWLFNIGKDIVTGLWNGVKNIWTTVTGWFGDIGKLITTAIGDLGSLLFNIGKSIITGLFNGIKAIWNDVTGFIGGIGSWIGKHKGPIEADAVLLVPHGMAIMSGLHAGLKAGIPPILSTLSNLSGQMGNSLSVGRGSSLSLIGGGSLGARSSFAGAGAGSSGSGGVVVNNTYNLRVTGDVSPQTVLLLDAKIKQHDQQLFTQLQAMRS